MSRSERTDDRPLVFAGSASRQLAANVCHQLGVPLSPGEVIRFSEGTVFVRADRNVRGRSVYLIQSTVFPANDQFMELLFWVDALRRADAASITIVMPYFCYSKGDKKDEPRVSIRARVCADAIECAGADRIITMDLHAPQLQGFFHVPVDDLYALPVLCNAIEDLRLQNPVVVSPDAGFVKKAGLYAQRLDTPLAIVSKRRSGHKEEAEAVDLVGEVSGRDAVIVDDFTITCGTLAAAAERLLERGARTVVAAVTHGVWTEGSMQRLDASPIDRVLVTDTVEHPPVIASPKVEVVSVSRLLADALRRLHANESLSSLLLPLQ